jgi:hypothetical protein
MGICAHNPHNAFLNAPTACRKISGTSTILFRFFARLQAIQGYSRFNRRASRANFSLRFPAAFRLKRHRAETKCLPLGFQL